MRKILTTLIALLCTIQTVNAESINRTVQSLKINKSSLSVMIKDIRDGNIIYSLNERTPRVPASTLKVVTSTASANALGEEFQYKTGLYKSTNNDLYLKLSGDPLLSTSDLETLLAKAKEKEIIPKTFYIDDTEFDNVEWGEGWQWDDELNPLMPKFSIFNINSNKIKIEITPVNEGVSAKIKVKPFYPMTFINQVTTSYKLPNSVKLTKNDSIAQNMYLISGNISKLMNLTIPVPNPKINFKLRLDEAITSKKLEYYDIKYAKMPETNIYLVEEVSHDIKPILSGILKNSNNLFAETLFKTAGAQWTNDVGSIENSTEMLNDYLNKINLNTDDIKIVDGSGVSKNNLMTSEFMVNFLEYQANNSNFEDFKTMLPTPGEGTLKNRMLYFKNNLYAKTGTLSDNSSIAGYLTTKRGRIVAFDIMINDAKTSDADKKNIEEQILRSIFMNY